MNNSTAKSPAIPPSVKPDWIGGHFRQFRKDPTGFLERLASLGDVSFFRMGAQPAFFVNHPELIRDVLVVNAHKFQKGRALQRAKALLGEGLLTNEGQSHLRQRRMIQPAFHRQRIADYSRSMVEFADRMSGTWNEGEVRDIDKEMMHLTLQIVGKTLFSSDVESEADEVGQAMTTIVKLFNFLLLPFAHWLQKLPLPHSNRFRQAKNTLDSVIYRMINERRTSGQDTGDLLSMLLAARDEDDGTPMTNEQIRDEALTLFLAGHETTANALTWTWMLLSQNPEKEAKLHEELDSVFAGRLPDISDLANLRYTESVIAESMRLFPPAWAIGRLATDEHAFGYFKVPTGSLLLISPYVTQRDPRFWADADKFIPERWAEQSIKEAGQKNIFLPFGGGIRRCIGESFAWTEAILVVATLARRWRLRVVPEQRFDLQPMITLRPKYGMKMSLNCRQAGETLT